LIAHLSSVHQPSNLIFIPIIPFLFVTFLLVILSIAEQESLQKPFFNHQQ
jgi:hypothetical protein